MKIFVTLVLLALAVNVISAKVLPRKWNPRSSLPPISSSPLPSSPPRSSSSSSTSTLLSSSSTDPMQGRTHPLNLVRICQGDTTHLACPNNEVLSISDAMYGRTVSGKVACPHRSVPKNVKGLTCKGAQTKQKVQSMCEGRPKCSVTARDFTFGNPCKGVYKHLDIEFYCTTPEPSPTPVPANPTTSDYSKQLYQEIFRCTKLYTEILDKDPEQECPALKAYKDCLTQTEETYPESVEDINRAMPTLDSALQGCHKATLKPAAAKMMVCKNHHYKPPCMNVTGDMSDLKTFNNKISSIKVFSGYWQLYTEPQFTGSVYQIPPGYAHPFLSFLSPDVGRDIELSNDDLSSLRPIQYSEYIDTATDPTDAMWQTRSERPTGLTTEPIEDGTGLPEHSDPSVSIGRASVTQEHVRPVTKQQYSRWINLDDVDSQWPNMCTENSCLLGVRILYPRLENMSPASHQTFEKMIVDHIKDIFDILPEQLVLVEMVEKTSELIIEIIDMDAAPSVASIAAQIEDLIKSEKLSVTVNGRLISPLPDRFGVMLKTVDENMIPKRKDNNTPIIEPVVPSETPVHYLSETSASESNNVEDTHPYPMIKPGQTLEVEVEEQKLQRKLILTVAATVSLLVLVGLVIIVSISVMRRRQSYTLISKAPSSANVYIVAEATPTKKGVEGFENPSYMLDEVDM